MNLANSQEIRILELAQRIKQLMGSVSRITFHRLPEDDPRRRCPDIGRAEKLLGWKPKSTLEEGLEGTIRWFQKK